VTALEQFIYVDASWQVKTKTRTTFEPWIRIKLADVKNRIVIPSGNHNCFKSVQRYRQAVSDRDSAETFEASRIDGNYQMHYCGLFFDFDAKPGEGEHLRFAIERARKEANKLCNFFLTRFQDINPAHVQVWFSGGKGFHVLVRPEVFGITPHTHLTYMIKNMAWSLGDLLDLDTLDRGVYTISRLWRIHNSVHQSTNLRKTELDVRELSTLTASDIIKRAGGSQPEQLFPEEEYENIAAVIEASAWWDDWERYYKWQDEMSRHYPSKRVTRPEGEDGLPVCMANLRDVGVRPGGKQRNHTAMVMATYWKDMGYSIETCREYIDDWTKDHYGGREPRELKENIANSRSAVRSVYSDAKYAFTCASIRACGTKTKPVPCNFRDCKWVPNQEDQEPEDVPLVHLSEASRGIYDGKRTRIPVHVSGKGESPYIVPLKGTVTCPKNPDHRCKFCRFSDEPNNVFEWEIGAGDRGILQMIDVNDNVRKGTIKQLGGFPKDCYKNKVEFGDISNVEALRLIPMVDYASEYQEKNLDDDEVVKRSSQHVVRDGYYIGHGLQANKKYNMIAYTYSHPKDQRAVHVIEQAKPNQNDIEHFKLNDKMKKRLMVFQRKAGQDVTEKIYEIHKDLCHNVHQIGGLPNLSHAIDLCFHSVIGFNFMDKFVHKGWFELLVVGDSSAGKSTMVQRLIKHFRVGEMLAGEEAKRSGLVWASVQINGKWTLIWGKIPQNDRRLLVIDEFADMDQDEVAKLTQMRSEGRAVGQGVSSEFETWARTRLILLTNVRGCRDLSSYSFGIQAVGSIFKTDQDLRRTDLAVTVRKGEVPARVVNKRYKKGEIPHVYTSDLCHNLILWAWSRNPNHIEFVDDSEEEIIKLSQEIGERYDSNYYLVEMNDMRHKLARVSCAVAARLFSTDKRCIKVIVTPEHVQYAAALFDRCYGRGNPNSSMKYHQYARNYQLRNHFTEERRQKFRERLDKFGSNKDTVLLALIGIQDFRKMDLNDQLAMEKEEFNDFWKFLMAQQFISRTPGSVYRKSGPFNDFLNALLHNLDDGEGSEEVPF